MQPAIKRPTRPRCRRVSRRHGGFWVKFEGLEDVQRKEVSRASFFLDSFVNLRLDLWTLGRKTSNEGFKVTPEKHDQRDR